MLKTDVQGFYESINHTVLIAALMRDIDNDFVFRLLYTYIKRTVEYGGCYREIHRGISRGSALSPVIGAYYLKKVDDAFTGSGLFYRRYMDDIVILTPSRWSLRKAVVKLNGVFAALKVTKHPDKTFIGKIERRFDFLGYRFSRQLTTLAAATWQRFRERLHRLYEQNNASPEGDTWFDDYVTRWLRWTGAGLGFKLDLGGYPFPANDLQRGQPNSQ